MLHRWPCEWLPSHNTVLILQGIKVTCLPPILLLKLFNPSPQHPSAYLIPSSLHNIIIFFLFYHVTIFQISTLLRLQPPE